MAQRRPGEKASMDQDGKGANFNRYADKMQDAIAKIPMSHSIDE
jgi:hypothetical protein